MIKRVEQLNPKMNVTDDDISLSIYDEGHTFNSTTTDNVAVSRITSTGQITIKEPRDRSTDRSKQSPIVSRRQSPRDTVFRRPSQLPNITVRDSKGHEKQLDQPKLQEKESEVHSEKPLIFGDFTNWKGQEMMRLDDFILLLAKKYGR